MNYQELKNILGFSQGGFQATRITVTCDTFGAGISSLLEYCYDNQPAVIDQVVLLGEQEASKTIRFAGTANFLNIPNLPTEAAFSIDEQGSVQVEIRYKLRDMMPGPNDWIFSRSFPRLPQSPDHSRPVLFDRRNGKVEEPMSVPLDELFFYDTWYVVCSRPGTDPYFGKPLRWGINFMSRIKPLGPLGIISNLFRITLELTVYGRIRKALPTETPQNLAAQYPASPEMFLYPWDVAADFDKGIPNSILLEIDLGLHYALLNDKAVFDGDKFVLFSPLDPDWILFHTNPRFQPMQAFTGRVNLPEAGMSMNMISPFVFGLDEFQLVSAFKGLSLANLSQLAGLTGSGQSPLDMLPDELKNAAGTLGQLELCRAAFSVSFTNPLAPELGYVSFSIGMPELKWNIWENHLVIENIFVTVSVTNPLGAIADPDNDAARELNVMINGSVKVEGIPFSVYASNRDGFTVFASLEQGRSLPLASLMQKFAPALPVFADLQINKFQIGASPGRYLSFALGMADEPRPWVLPVGPQGLTVSDVGMGLQFAKGSGVTGSVSGSVALGEFAKLNATYDLPGDVALRALLPEVNTKDLFGLFGEVAPEIPEALSFRLKQNSVLIQKRGSNYLFQLATWMDELGLVAVQVQKENGKWGMAFGLNLISGLPSDLPGLDFLSVFENTFRLNKFMVVVSSFAAPGFQFPEMAQFNTPRLNAHSVALPSQATTLVAGLNIYAQWQPNKSDKVQNLLQNLLGLPKTIGITLQVGKNPSAVSKLFVSLSARVQGQPFLFTVGAQILNGQLGMFLTGQFKVEIQGNVQTFDVITVFVPTGAFLSGSMRGQTAIDFGLFKLSNLALAVGINWSGIPSLGVAGTISVTKFQSSIAVFFDSTNPSKSLVAGSVTDLSLDDILDTFAGEVAPSEIDKLLRNFELKGTHSFRISASLAKELDELNLEKVAEECLAKGRLQMPLAQEQYLLVVNEKGKRWHYTDLTQMRHYSFKKTSEGIEVSTDAQFYFSPQITYIGAIMFPQGFYLNGAIDILGFHAASTITINPNVGISVEGTMSPIVLGHEKLFSLKAAEGKGGAYLSLSTFSDATRKEPKFRNPHFYINGQLTMLGMKKSAYVRLTTAGADFAVKGDLVPMVSGTIQGVFRNPKQMAAQGNLLAGIKDVDLGLLGKIPVSSGANCAMGISVSPGGNTVGFDAGFEFAGTKVSLGKFDLDFTTQDLADLPEILYRAIKSYLEEIFKNVKVWLDAVVKGLVTAYGTVSKVLKDAFNYSAQQVASLMKSFKFAATQVAEELKEVFNLSAKELAVAFKAAKYAGKEVAAGLKSAYKASEEAVAKAMKGADYAADEVASGLGSAFNASEKAVAIAMKGAGYSAEKVAEGLKEGLNASAKTVAKALKGAEYSAKEVAKGLKDGFDISVGAVQDAMEFAGYSGKTIGKAFQSLGGEFKKIGDKLNPSNW